MRAFMLALLVLDRNIFVFSVQTTRKTVSRSGIPVLYRSQTRNSTPAGQSNKFWSYHHNSNERTQTHLSLGHQDGSQNGLGMRRASKDRTPKRPGANSYYSPQSPIGYGPVISSDEMYRRDTTPMKESALRPGLSLELYGSTQSLNIEDRFHLHRDEVKSVSTFTDTSSDFHNTGSEGKKVNRPVGHSLRNARKRATTSGNPQQVKEVVESSRQLSLKGIMYKMCPTWECYTCYSSIFVLSKREDSHGFLQVTEQMNNVLSDCLSRIKLPNRHPINKCKSLLLNVPGNEFDRLNFDPQNFNMDCTGETYMNSHRTMHATHPCSKIANEKAFLLCLSVELEKIKYVECGQASNKDETNRCQAHTGCASRSFQILMEDYTDTCFTSADHDEIEDKEDYNDDE